MAPRFYDGIAPPQPNRWVSPPPQFKSSNQQPLTGHQSVRVASNGSVDPGSIFTQDGQAGLSSIPCAFVAPADRSPVMFDIKRVAEFPDPDGTHLATNVYYFTSSSLFAPGKDVLVTLQLSDQLPAPSDLLRVPGGWAVAEDRQHGTAAPFYIAVRATSLGCFAAGYPANANQTAQGPGSVAGRRCPSSSRWRSRLSCWRACPWP